MIRSLAFILLASLSLGCVQRSLSTSSSTNEKANGFTTPEAAAIEMFRASATKSEARFVQARLLGVCEGLKDWPIRYQQCLQTTQFRSENGDVPVDELANRLKDETARVIAGRVFSDEEVAKVASQFMSSYYCRDLRSYDVAARGGDGLDYRTRIIVSKNEDRWYAIPRCRSSQVFYRVADAMGLTLVAR